MVGEHRYDVSGVAVPDSLEQLHRLLADVAAEHPDLCASDVSMFETAVIEIAGNLVEHGRPPGEVDYRFTLTVHPDRLEGLLQDSGEELPGGPGGTRMPDELAEHGRGLLLARAALDELSYRRTETANTWRMTRYRK